MPNLRACSPALLLLLAAACTTSGEDSAPLEDDVLLLRAVAAEPCPEPSVTVLDQAEPKGAELAQEVAAACPCTGTTVEWKFGTRPVDEHGHKRWPGTATSAVSLQDCLNMLDGYAESFCSGQQLPADCGGHCDGTQTCQRYGEATDKVQVPNPAPGKFSCKATKGKCACKCK